MFIAQLQNLILLIITVAIFGTQVFCLIDLATRPARAFPAEGKRTKQFWLIVLGVAALFGFLALPYPLGAGNFLFLGMVSAVPAILYLVDVRPAVAPHGRGSSGRSGPRGGRGSGGW